MKVAGIIAEYNPFHNGHAYHIAETRRLTGADYMVVVMSGDFVQRGEPAILDKYARTRMALENGADLVIELPVAYACGSAEYFAAGAVRTLQALGVVDVLCFGCETTDLRLLSVLAQLYREEPTAFADALQNALRQGMTYPQARAAATVQYLTEQEQLLESIPVEELTQLLASPNMILGIEYLKAIHSYDAPMEVVLVPRKGSYHSEALDESGAGEQIYASATAIRALIKDISTKESISHKLVGQVPSSVAKILAGHSDFMSVDDFSSALGYALLSWDRDDLTQYVDLTRDLTDRIWNYQASFAGWNSFADQIKTKQMTRTRISRALLHFLLHIKQEDMTQWKTDGYAYYARILGFRKSCGRLLSAMKKNATVPLLTKVADARSVLFQWYQEKAPSKINSAYKLLERDIFAADLYETTAAIRYKKTKLDEYRHGIVMITDEEDHNEQYL